VVTATINRALSCERSHLYMVGGSQKKGEKHMELEIIRLKDQLASEKARLNRIAGQIKIEYQYFKSAEDMEMSIDLGENLRLQMQAIFDIFEKEGIKFD